MIPSVNTLWANALQQVMNGAQVAPNSAGANWRGSETREVLAFQTRWPMAMPVITSPARKMGYRFLCAEAAWILSGDNRVETIRPFAKHIAQFSDDGQRFFGAYGPKFIEQLSYVVKTLKADLSSRQAVINIWREQPRETKDTPCTLSWQFLVRNGRLNCVASMRSSDLMTGVPYDIFNFSMVAAMVALELRDHVPVRLGDLILTAGSQHIYERDLDTVRAVIAEDPTADPALAPIDLREFANTYDLIGHLWGCARTGVAHRSFLKELFTTETK